MPKNGPRATLRYSQDNLRNALQEIDRGMPIATASKQFGVPRTTLLYKKTGKYPRECRKGPSTNLTAFEEESLVRWLFHIADLGFPATKLQLIDSVEMIFKENKRANNFNAGRPGKKWYASFMRRHPEISYRVSQNLSSGRVAVNEEKIRNWFKEITTYLEENNYMAISEDPTRIFNADESAFFLSPKGSTVLVKKGTSTVYNFTANNDKECMTALLNANAAGMIAPPMVIYQYERVPAHITNKMPANWAIGKSESGWMTGQTFFEYIANVFLPWLKENNIVLPIIFFVDGHSSHLTLPLSNLCTENGIILIALCPNSTHITQPMDVAVFRTLKSAWRNAVHQWKIDNNGSKVKKEDFAPILENAISSSVTPEVLANGFKSTGLHPLDPNAIKYNKYFKADHSHRISRRDILEKSTSNDKVSYLEKFINGETLLEFQETIGNQWNGDVKHTSLYSVWKAMKNDNVKDASNYNSNIPHETQQAVENHDFENNIAPEQVEIETPAVTNPQVIGPGVHINQGPQPSTSNHVDSINVKDTSTNTNNIPHVTEQAVENHDFENNIAPEQVEIEIPAVTNPQQDIGPEVHINQEPQPSTSSNHAEIPFGNVPTPFKKCLFWPKSDQKETKRRSKEKLPAVAVSARWQEYQLKKQKIKEQNERAKADRKRQREMKQKISKEKIKQVKRKVLSSSSPDSSREVQLESEEELYYENAERPSSITDPSTLSVGDYVIVSYDVDYFPGIIKKITKSNALVSVMQKSLANTWKWPQREDSLWYEFKDILEEIEEPAKANERGAFRVPEFLKYSDYI